MITLQHITASLSVLSLGACGGSSLNFGPVNASNAAFAESDGVLAFTADDVDVRLTLNDRYDAVTFVGASSTNGDLTQILAVSETDDTFAAYFLTRDGGTSAQSFIGRMTDLEALPSGAATLEGTYVGSWLFEDEDPFNMYITGDATLDIDFDSMTISGLIDNRSAEIFGIAGFIFSEENATITLAETRINRDGSFAGADTSVIDYESGSLTETVQFEGLIGGSTLQTAEVVGTINRMSVPADTPDIFLRETGVFVAGH